MLAQPDAPVIHQGHKDNEQHAGGRDHQAVAGQRAVTDQQPQVLACHLCKVGQDHDAGQGNTPAAQPAGPGTEGPPGPGERGAAVRHGAVQLAEGVRDEQDGDEPEKQDQGSVVSVDGHDQAQRGGQRIHRCRGGEAQHDRVPEVQDSRAEPLGRDGTAGGPAGTAARRRRLLAHTVTGLGNVRGLIVRYLPCWSGPALRAAPGRQWCWAQNGRSNR